MDMPMPIMPHSLRRWLLRVAGLMMIAAALPCPGCSGRPRTVPPPTKAEAIAQARQMFEMHVEAILANPASAPRAIEPVVEMFGPLAAHHGSPFVEFLAAVKQARSSWGTSPTAAAVKKDLATLSEQAAALAP